MKIKEITSQSRRDFSTIYICENCEHEQKGGGYEDRNCHDNVIPNMNCRECSKSRNDLGLVDVPTATKYESWETV